jgi:hypothetical protein
LVKKREGGKEMIAVDGSGCRAGRERRGERGTAVVAINIGMQAEDEGT